MGIHLYFFVYAEPGPVQAMGLRDLAALREYGFPGHYPQHCIIGTRPESLLNFEYLIKSFYNSI